MEKQNTIAETMRKLMESGPSVTEFTSYKALNDAVGALHGLPAGKCQALAGEKAWAWYADPTTKTWRKATEEEIAAKRAAAAGKSHGVRGSKVMSAEDRAALDAQVTALQAVANPALAPLLAELLARRNADDAARKGCLKDRLQEAVTKLGLEKVVAILEARVAVLEEQVAAEPAAETDTAETPDAENA